MANVTPGERAKNWASSAATLWPILVPLLGATVYGNSEAVRTAIHGEQLEPVDGIHQPDNGNFEAQVKASIADIVAELKRQRGKDSQLQTQLQAQDDENLESLESQIEMQQAQIDTLKALVQ